MSTSESLSSPVDPTGFASVVGIDVGSERLVSTICHPDKRQVAKPSAVGHDRPGFELIDHALRALGVEPTRILIGLEATSRSNENLYQFLAGQGYTLCLLHPRQTHQFAEQRGLRAKTDRLDATTIARVLLSGEARVGSVPDELIATSRELERLHSGLPAERARSERNPCPAGGALPRVHSGLRRPLWDHRPGGAQALSGRCRHHDCRGRSRDGHLARTGSAALWPAHRG
jgi:transposase